MFFKAKAGDREYVLERMTLGMWRELKRDFGVNVTDLDTGDPDTIIGLLYLAAKQGRPDASREDLLAEIEDIDLESIFADDELASDTDPTPAEDATVPADQDAPATDGAPAPGN